MTSLVSEWLNIYMPVAGRLTHIAPQSAIVGTPESKTDSVLIDYEGNLYDAENLRTWEERVRNVADRHRTRYPTIARERVDAEDLVLIGRMLVSGLIDLYVLDEPDRTNARIWTGR